MKSKIVIITSVVGLMLVSIGITYAFFSARISGIESASTIAVSAGTMSITYTEGNGDLTLSNIYPRNEAWLTKVFTVSAQNTTGLTMNYEISINVTNNSFPDDYIKYTLSSSGTGSGETAITKTTKTSLNGTGVKHVGYGGFGTNTSGAHTYTLSLYFYDNGLDQNNGQGKVFNAKVLLAGYDGELLDLSNPANMPGTYFGWETESNTFSGADVYNIGIVVKKFSQTLMNSYVDNSKNIFSLLVPIRRISFYGSWGSSLIKEEIPYACGMINGTEVCVNYKMTEEELVERCTTGLITTGTVDDDGYVQCSGDVVACYFMDNRAGCYLGDSPNVTCEFYNSNQGACSIYPSMMQ